MQNAVTAEIVEPYAEALMSLAKEKNITDQVGDNIRSLKALFDESQDLTTLLASPLAGAGDKKEVIKKIAGGQIDSFLLNFLLLLVDRQRINVVEAVFDKYLENLRKLNNIVLAEVTSAVEISEADAGKLVEKVKALTGAKGVEMETNVDPDIIGGVIIKVGSQIFDASIKGQLRRISRSMLGNS